MYTWKGCLLDANTDFLSFSEVTKAQVLVEPALVGAGPNARPRREGPVGSGFMMSSCSVNRAIRLW